MKLKEKLDKDTRIIELANNIKNKLEEKKIYSFKKEPTIYYTILKTKYILIEASDENQDIIKIIEKNGKDILEEIFHFYIEKNIYEDKDEYNTFEDFYDIFFIDMVVNRVEEQRFIKKAYNRNLQRIGKLEKDKHYFAAIVIIVSAFEAAMNDFFFSNSDIWFFTLESGSYWEDEEKIYEKWSNKDDSKESLTTVNIMGHKKYNFSKENYEKFLVFQKINTNEKIYKICKKLGIDEKYFRYLASNSFEEINFYEILKYVLEEEHTKNYKLNFQSIDNVRSLIKDFFPLS